MVFFTQKTFELSIKQTFWNHSYCYFFFIAMQFQNVSLTEPYDIAIGLKGVEKETRSDELKYRIKKNHSNLMKILLFEKLIFTVELVV